MRLWHWLKTQQDHSGAEKFAFVSDLELPLFQNSASPFAAPIVKNLRPMGNIDPFQGGQVQVLPAVGIAGYGGVVSGQMFFAPLQSQDASSGGL